MRSNQVKNYDENAFIEFLNANEIESFADFKNHRIVYEFRDRRLNEEGVVFSFEYSAFLDGYYKLIPKYGPNHEDYTEQYSKGLKSGTKEKFFSPKKNSLDLKT